MSNFRADRTTVKYEGVGIRLVEKHKQILEAEARRRGLTVSDTVRNWIAGLARMESNGAGQTAINHAEYSQN